MLLFTKSEIRFWPEESRNKRELLGCGCCWRGLMQNFKGVLELEAGGCYYWKTAASNSASATVASVAKARWWGGCWKLYEMTVQKVAFYTIKAPPRASPPIGSIGLDANLGPPLFQALCLHQKPGNHLDIPNPIFMLPSIYVCTLISVSYEIWCSVIIIISNLNLLILEQRRILFQYANFNF